MRKGIKSDYRLGTGVGSDRVHSHILDTYGGPLKKTLATAAVLLLTASLSACGGGAAGDSKPEQSAAFDASEEHTVIYEVTSDAATAVIVSYDTSSNGTSEAEDLTDVALPFTKEMTFKKASKFDGVHVLIADPDPAATTISCKITVDGEVLDEQTVTGPKASANCSG